MRETIAGRAIAGPRARSMRWLATALLFAGAGCSNDSVVNTGRGGGAGGGGGAGTSGSGGATSAPSSDAGAPTGGIPLPMTVTSVFNNQGWFGDPSVSASFTAGSTVIQQTDSSSGPCASRDASARGKCLQIIYTPPAGLTPPAGGGYVGVFFLTTLAAAHPELSPPANVGEANWGVEPGAAVAPGATKISFLAAASSAGLPVTFKAGTDKDAFVLPETQQTLQSSWLKYTLPLDGQSYGASVIGAFAWVLKDTTRPATFYLDGIVWER